MDLISDKIREAIIVEKKDLDPCVKQADFTIPAPQVKMGYEIILKQFAKNVNLPGFRKGKAPPSMVKNLHAKEVSGETLQELMGSCFRKVSADEDIVEDSIDFPKDSKPPETLDLAADFHVSLIFNVYPKIDLPQYKGIQIEAVKSKVTDEEVEKRLVFYREIYGRFEKVDVPADKGDMLKVSYSSDLELPPETAEHVRRLVKAEENYIWIGENEILPGVNAALVGATAGKTCDVVIEFPATHDEKALAGKKGNYKISVLEVQRKRPLADDQELCTKLMLKTVDELKENIRKQLDRDSQRESESLKRGKVLDAITKDASFPVPPALVDELARGELRKILSSRVKPDAPEAEIAKEFEANRDTILAEARAKSTERVRQFILLREIAKKEDIKVEQDEFNRHIQGISDYLGYSTENVLKRLSSTGRISKVVDECLAGKVTDFLIANAKEI